MKQAQWIAAALAALLPFAALAQSAAPQPDPVDASVAVPPPGYLSAFAGYVPAAAEGQAAPDKVWRAANDKVAQSDPHAGHDMAPEPAKETPPEHSQHRAQ